MISQEVHEHLDPSHLSSAGLCAPHPVDATWRFDLVDGRYLVLTGIYVVGQLGHTVHVLVGPCAQGVVGRFALYRQAAADWRFVERQLVGA